MKTFTFTQLGNNATIEVSLDDVKAIRVFNDNQTFILYLKSKNHTTQFSNTNGIYGKRIENVSLTKLFISHFKTVLNIDEQCVVFNEIRDDKGLKFITTGKTLVTFAK